MMLTGSERANFTNYPLLWLAIVFAAGIVAADHLDLGPGLFLVACLIPAFLSAAFIRRPAGAICLLFAFLAAGGLARTAVTRGTSESRLKSLYDTSTIVSGDPIEIEGVLSQEPEAAVGGFFLLIRSESAIYKGWKRNVSGGVRLFAISSDQAAAIEFAKLDLRYGSRVRIACRLRRRDDFLNPGVASRKRILDSQNIDASGTVKSPLLIEKLSDGPKFDPFAYLYQFRKELINDFRETFNRETAGVLIASILGNRHFLDKRTAEVFREDGTFHVLVISGVHITFIGGLTLLLVGLLTRKRLWQFLLASAFLWAYSLAVGAEVPVVRAALMFSFLLFSRAIHRQGTLLNSLGGCVLILLIWRPEDIFSQSFQLTLISVTAIIAMAFPLIENLRAIGRWTPTAETPFPPDVPRWLRRFSETLYWRAAVWDKEAAKQIWSGRLFKEPQVKWLAKKGLRGIVRYCLEGLVVSLVVQAWLLPLLVVYFHRLSIFSVLLNLWVGINIAAASIAASAAILISQINGALALPLVTLTHFFSWFLLSVPRVLVEANLASVRIPVYSGNMRSVYFLYFLPLTVLALLVYTWRPFARKTGPEFLSAKLPAILYLRVSLFSLFVMSAVIVFHPFSAPRPDGRLHIDFLDVGQGDSALITFPDGQTMLVDGGGRMDFNKTGIAEGEESVDFEPDTPSIGEAVVSEFLWERGYSGIDFILATHADADHMQGLADVAKNFRVRQALFGRTPPEEIEFAAVSSVLTTRGIPAELVSRGDVFDLGGVRVEVLFPEKDESAEAASDNNHSVVLRFVYGSRKILLTGDIERETEQVLVQNSVLDADVVKVAHHGSRTSSTKEFIDAAAAEYAVIPVGIESRFSHPHPEIIKRWQDSGALVLTVGVSGTVSISTDGKDLTINTFVK